jgi:Arc/MetJ-type ribon-helix-helix transcriptional regulator
LSTDETIRKSVSLPASLWDAVDEARRQWPGRVPSESEAVRVLLQEALIARGVVPKQPTRRRQPDDIRRQFLLRSRSTR